MGIAHCFVAASQVVQHELAAAIEPVARVQARLVRDEGDRARRPHGDSADRAARRIETGRHVDRQHGRAAGVDAPDERGERGIDVAVEPDAQQPVDDERRVHAGGPFAHDGGAT